MAKKDTETDVVDDKLDNAEIPGNKDTGSDDDGQEQDTSVRGAIQKAMEEVEDKDGGDEGRVSSDTDASRVDRKRGASKDLESDDKEVPQRAKAKKEEKEEDEGQVPKEEGQEKEKVDPPPGYWNKKGREAWDKLDATVKQHIVAREQEVSNGFAQISQRLKSFEEIEQAIAPRAQVIQQFGVSPAQTIDRLFQWMEALSHKNPRLRANAFKQLANDFGVPINQLVPSGSQGAEGSETEGQTEQAPNEPPEWFQQYAQHTNEQLNGVQQVIANQRQTAAQAVVQGWGGALDKDGKRLRPYFERVAPMMARLSMPSTDERGNIIAPAIVPFKNGEVDLEAAYEMAVKLDPEIQSLIQQETSEKAKKDAEEAAKKDAKARAEKLARAKRAGSGLKPSAPALGTAPVNSNQRKANGSRQPSVRDAITAALEEARE